MRRIVVASISLLLGISAAATAQTFSSGSTGADGALDLAAMACTECEVQLPPSGVLNYTTVNVPAGKTLKFRKNALNTPVHLLAQGAVAISGVVSVNNTAINAHGDLDASIPGPGGFPGGGTGQPGLGPGGGAAVGDRNGRWVGPLSLVPIVGGSGGGDGGCGGGGGVLIASSQSIAITTTGSISAVAGSKMYGNASPGSGGAIRLVANSLNVAGSLSANSWFVSSGFVLYGNVGMIRLEAPLGSLSFTGSATPAPVISEINPSLVSAALPSLTIVSVGGRAVPSYAGNRMDAADLVLPN